MGGIWGRITSTLPAPHRDSPLFGPWKVVQGLNTRLYRASGGRIGGRYDDAPVCILHHRGAKSGQPRETPLVHLADGERIVIVASMGGAPRHPNWFHNLRANPDVEVQIGTGRRPYRARIVEDPQERAALWPRLLEVWPAWEAYQRRTDRVLPVIVLEPR